MFIQMKFKTCFAFKQINEVRCKLQTPLKSNFKMNPLKKKKYTLNKISSARQVALLSNLQTIKCLKFTEFREKNETKDSWVKLVKVRSQWSLNNKIIISSEGLSPSKNLKNHSWSKRMLILHPYQNLTL